MPTSTPADTSVGRQHDGARAADDRRLPKLGAHQRGERDRAGAPRGPRRPGNSQALVAPAVVVAARKPIWRARAPPSDASGPSCSNSSGVRRRGERKAMVIAGSMSVRRLTSSIWRAPSGDAPGNCGGGEDEPDLSQVAPDEDGQRRRAPRPTWRALHDGGR